MPGGQANTDLEQRLAVPILELIEDGPSGGVGEGLEHVAHADHYRQVVTCLSTAAPTRADARPGFALTEDVM